MACQRAGRAGRISDGFCYRLWDLTTQDRMLKNRLPEIEYADLTPLMLDLIKWGEPNPENLTWLTPPDKTSVNLSKELLKTLEAVDDNYSLTPLGEELSRIPSHPRIAKMLVQARKYSLLPLASDIAAILDNRDPLPRDYGTDINLRIERLRLNRREKRHNKSFDRIELYAMELRKMFKVQEDNSEFDSYDTGLLLAEAFPERIASAKPGNNAQFMLSNGTIAMLGHEDSLAGESWLAVAALNAKEKIAKIFLASPLNPVSLKNMLREKESVLWNTKKGGIVALKQLKIGSMVLQEKPFVPDSQEVEQIVLSAVKKEGEVLLDFNDEVINLQNRILSLRIWNGEDFMPDVSTKTLIETAQNWLLPYLSGVNTVEKLKKIDIFSALKYSLTPLEQRDLEKLAPAFLEVPTGHKIKLKYSALGLQPVLAVRLQEVFSWQETPKINGGKISVLMHLLSPGFKPVQVTSDLKSFWQNAYKEVRKELKRRYPKHQWPEL